MRIALQAGAVRRREDGTSPRFWQLRSHTPLNCCSKACCGWLQGVCNASVSKLHWLMIGVRASLELCPLSNAAALFGQYKDEVSCIFYQMHHLFRMTSGKWCKVVQS